jgi:hypothetical protein
MSDCSLPDGARGIECDDFAVEFRGDKIVFVVKTANTGKHYTLQAGAKSGVIDLHETFDRPGESDQHRTFFAVRRDDLIALLGQSGPMLGELLGLLRRLRIGWLKHRNIGIARGVDPVSDADIAAITRKRRKRLVLDAGLYGQNVLIPEFLEGVYDFPDGDFSLFHRGRQIGIGFKKTDPGGRIHLFWIKRRDLIRFSNEWQDKLGRAFASIAIQREEYPQYPFLRA